MSVSGVLVPDRNCKLCHQGLTTQFIRQLRSCKCWVSEIYVPSIREPDCTVLRIRTKINVMWSSFVSTVYSIVVLRNI